MDAMTNGAGGYTPIVQLLGEIGTSWDAGAHVAALAMVYVGMDTMAFLSCKHGKVSQDRSDFIDWIDRYLKADPTSTYQYDGWDVYAARCALLHSYGSEANLHREGKAKRMFGYTDNGLHRSSGSEGLVIISSAVFIHDFSRAVERFIQTLTNDKELKARVQGNRMSLG